MFEHLKNNSLLDKDIHYLNHGSFGACPKPVFEVYQAWQRELENQPVEFIGRRWNELLGHARTRLAEYLGCQTDEVVYFQNPTTSISMVARSLKLQPGDQVLTTDHSYGAMDRLWGFVTENSGAEYHRHPIGFPLTTHADFIEEFWQAVTPNTKIIFLDHISSATALRFPVEEICRRAREVGIITIIDGAHAPGQIELNLSTLGADFYTGALHKWVCAPKGAAFLYARKDIQHLLNPLVVSWGYQAEFPSGSEYIDHHEFQGTRDPAAFLTVPAALDYQAANDWENVQTWSRQQVLEIRREVNVLTGVAPICPEGEGWLEQLAAIQLPELDVNVLKTRLYDEFKIEIPVYRWENIPILRVSINGYNDQTDRVALIEAMKTLIPEIRG